MSGIVNQTGARSGVVGTTVGTPASGPGDGKANAWFLSRTSSYNATGTNAMIPFDRSTPHAGSPTFVGSNITAGSGGDLGSITISVAGIYYVSYYSGHNGNTTGDDDLAIKIDSGTPSHRGYVIYDGNEPGYVNAGSSGLILCPNGNEKIYIWGNGAFYAVSEGSMLYWQGFRVGDLP